VHDPVVAAYDAAADVYDIVTADYDHARWLGEIERLARSHGLEGRLVLDIGCGTGSSFLPLLDKGYEVVGCDISPRMLARAAERAPGVRLDLADMRRLDVLGRFDLVLCLDDTLNYVLELDELKATFAGIARNLSPSGIAVWDVNTSAMYRTAFAEPWLVSAVDPFILWEGRTDRAFERGGIAELTLHAFSSDGRGGWRRSVSHHVQRHWPHDVITQAAGLAGLEIVSVHGQHTGARLDRSLDDDDHTKALYFARQSPTPS
jgi:SAM-dependent methyltransferase